MEVKLISISVRKTLNMHNYNSLSIERRIDAEINKTDDLNECVNKIREKTCLLLDKDIKIIKEEMKKQIKDV